ncbi:monofunctional biosynthetic peptidoglycan transglycosylase [Bizionia sp. KMM 8389]
MFNKLFKFIFKTILWFVFISILWVFSYKWLPVPVTSLMLIRSAENTENKLSFTWKHDWVALKDISKNLQLAVICSEDQNFLKHHGFDFKAIEKAFESNKTGKRIKGGSTISQQTAKNVFLWPQRSWFRKGLEVYFTFLIEILWTKERIMEVYLNSIEMGPGIYGAESASKYWFKKSAADLTPSQAAAIAAILPNPLNYKATPATAYIARRKQWIVKQMRYFGVLNYKSSSEHEK